MIDDIDLRDEHNQLCTFYDETERLLDQPDDALFGVKEAVSGWSPAHHLYHAWLASGKSLAAALYIAQGRGGAEGMPNDTGRAVLTQETIPRQQMDAPDMVRPPADVDHGALAEALTRSRRKLEEIGAHLDALGTAEGRLPHPRLGALNGPQWLRFVRIHAQHHHAIIRDILSSHAASSK